MIFFLCTTAIAVGIIIPRLIRLERESIFEMATSDIQATEMNQHPRHDQNPSNPVKAFAEGNMLQVPCSLSLSALR